MEGFELPNDNEEGEIVRREDMSPEAIDYLYSEFFGKSLDILRSELFHYSELKTMKQEELDMALRMFAHVIDSLGDKSQYKHVGDLSEWVSQRELAEVAHLFSDGDDLYDEQTKSYIAGQVIALVKRITSEHEKGLGN
jgi:hypothetical protein